MKRHSLIVIVAVIAFVGGLSVRWLISAPQTSAGQTSEKPLPDFSLPDLSGKPRSIKEWQGKVLVINFWATWCPPCLKEMPAFAAMQEEFSGQGLQFIGIAIDEAESVKAFIDKNKVSYPILIGETEGAKLAHSMGNLFNTVPFTVIVNKQDQIVKAHMGELSREQLLEILKPLFDKP